MRPLKAPIEELNEALGAWREIYSVPTPPGLRAVGSEKIIVRSMEEAFTVVASAGDTFKSSKTLTEKGGAVQLESTRGLIIVSFVSRNGRLGNLRKSE